MAVRLSGIIPSPPVVYRDATCREVDLDAVRDHLRFLLEHPIGGLCIGGHAGETECLTLEERMRVLRVAVEEVKGRMPVMGGVIADSTWSAIDQARQIAENGGDVALVCPPNIVGWDAETADAMLVEHCRAIDTEAKIPFVVYGGPGDRSSCRIMPKTFTALATQCENLVGMKIAVRGIATGENSFADCVAALRDAGAQTGRDVAPLIAGDANLLGALEAGAAGTINACESIRVEDNTALYAAYRKGETSTAKSLADRLQRLADVIYGLKIGRSFTYFHYRFKIATWMLGRIPNPAMRLPQVPPPADEVAMIEEALAAAGKHLVHGAAEFAGATRAVSTV